MTTANHTPPHLENGCGHAVLAFGCGVCIAKDRQAWAVTGLYRAVAWKDYRGRMETIA